ncbi:hypothetical protein O3P69_020657 [Scylla paramamosain]|uniref:CN hydrolase domain-containing protein n=2 Tax=Scylla paramamosain TaxID=85552 RepID=A0AAW0TMU7_SCYPA
MLCVRLLLLAAAVGADEVRYTGAVLEHEPYSSWESGGLAILQENARIFLEHAALARQQGADIMVFPEYGLTSTNLEGGDVLSLAQVVPHPADQVVLCFLNQTSSHTQVLRELSCGAAQLKLYLVVDLIELVHCSPNQILDCPDVGYYLYNTQVVLDHCGALVARYRKKHLFLEPGFIPGDESDATAVFTTDFGVTFTLQICFDIMYESPGLANVEGGVRDVAMSTAWIDELPFLTGPMALLARLEAIHRRLERLKESPDIIVNYVVLDMFTNLLPGPLARRALNTHGVTLVASNLPGPQETIHMFGGVVDDIMFWIPNKSRTGIGVSMLSYRGQVRLGLNVDTALVNSEEVAQQLLEDTIVQTRSLLKELGAVEIEPEAMLSDTVSAVSETELLLGEGKQLPLRPNQPPRVRPATLTHKN